MKAITITKPGDPDVMKVEERPIPKLGPGEVLIRVRAAGVNRPDIMQRQGVYPAPAGAPQDIPGLEVAGEIESISDPVDWKVGDKVCALVPGGGYAEFVAVNGGQCLPIPRGFSYQESAGLPETVFTVWHNVFQRGRLQAGEHFLVHGGTSGIGITAIQLTKAWGAKVFATAGSTEKCKACLDLGADQCINYKEQDFESAWKDVGIDVILDMVGGDYFEKNLSILRPEGRLVHINAMNGNLVNLNIMKMMLKRLSITGSTLRSREISFKTQLTTEVRKVVWPIIESGQFRPMIHRVFPLKKAPAAHRLMESSTHIGKIILAID